jgi:hypothetical protein
MLARVIEVVVFDGLALEKVTVAEFAGAGGNLNCVATRSREKRIIFRGMSKDSLEDLLERLHNKQGTPIPTSALGRLRSARFCRGESLARYTVQRSMAEHRSP